MLLWQPEIKLLQLELTSMSQILKKKPAQFSKVVQLCKSDN